MTFTGTDASLLQAASWGLRAVRNIRLVSELPNEAAHFETCAVETAIMAAHCYYRDQIGCDWCGLPLGLDPVTLEDNTEVCYGCGQHFRGCDGCGRQTHDTRLDGRPTDRLGDAWTSYHGQFCEGCR